MLEDDPELAVIGEASNGAEAVELTAIFAAPDMVPREISRTVEIALPEGRAGTSAQRTPTEHASDESVLVPAADITAFPYPVPDHRV